MKKNYLPLLLLGGAALAFFAFKKKKPKGKVIVPEPEKLSESEYKRYETAFEPTLAAEVPGEFIAPKKAAETAQVDYIAPQQVIDKGLEQPKEQMISPVETETVTLPGGQKVKRKKTKAVPAQAAPIQKAIEQLSTGKKAETQKILKKEVLPVAKKPVATNIPDAVKSKVSTSLPKVTPVAKKTSVPTSITKAVAPKKPLPVAKKPAPVVKKIAPVASKPLPVAKKPSVPASITKAVAPKPLPVAKKPVAPVNIVVPKPIAKPLPIAAKPVVKAAPKPAAPVNIVAPVAAKPIVKAVAPVIAPVIKKPLPIAAKGKKVGEFPIYG